MISWPFAGRLKRLKASVEESLSSSDSIRTQLSVYLYVLQLSKFAREPVEGGPHHTRAVPRLGLLWDIFQSISTVFLLVSATKNVFRQQVMRVLLYLFDRDHQNRLFGREPHCWVPGRLIMHEGVRTEFSLCLALFVLAYRFHTRPFASSLLYFLVQDDHTVDAFYKQHARQVADERAARKRDEPVLGNLAWHPLNQFMCYPVNDDGTLVSRLKLNRTCQARELLKRKVVWITMVAWTWFTLWTLSVLLLSVAFTLSDYGYLYAYKGCDLELERDYEAASDPIRLWSKYSFHRLYMSMSDLAENWTIFLCFGGSVSIMFTFPYLLHADLLLLAVLLDRKVRMLYRRRRALHRRGHKRASSYKCKQENDIDYLLRRSQREPDAAERGGSLVQWCKQRQIFFNDQDAELRDLCWQLRDFFAQVAEVDQLIGHLVSVAFISWLISVIVICNAAIGYSLSHPEGGGLLLGYSVPSLLYFGLPLGAVPLTAASLHLFKLNSNAMKTYHVLQSLLATSQNSITERVNLSLEIYEYFVHLKRHCYKLLYNYPFKATSYLSLIGWTVSSLAILASLVYRS